jgi:hypothetical protein
MKKVVFSLVAFMAFSVSAFANTVEVKEEVMEKEEVAVIDCYDFAAGVEKMMAPQGGDLGYEWFKDAYEWCVDGGHCSNCVDEIVIVG